MRTAILFLAAGAWLIAGSAKALTYNEVPTGDLSSTAAAPTALAFTLGTNTVIGTVQSISPVDMRDFITFTVPAGQRLSALRLVAWSGGNRGFHAINSGATSFDPSGGTAASFLGGDHVDPDDVGLDLLPALSDHQTDGTPVGSGFSVPLGPGTYSYVIQQTSSASPSNYTLEFVFSSAPAVPSSNHTSLAGLIVGLLAAGAWHQLRRKRPASSV